MARAGNAELKPAIDYAVIEKFLAVLRTSYEFRIGTIEELRVAELTTELFARAAIGDVRELKTLLRPVLAKTSEESDRFDIAFDHTFPPALIEPPRQRSAEGPPKSGRPTLALRHFVLGFAALVVAGAISMALYSPTQKPADTAAPPTRGGPPPTPPPTGTNPNATSLQARSVVAAVLDASRAYSYAPSLKELGEAMGPAQGWPSKALSLRLAQISGLPRLTPLPLLSDRTALSRIAVAVAVIEHRPEPIDFTGILAESTKQSAAIEQTPPYRIASKWTGPSKTQSTEGLRDQIKGWAGKSLGVAPDTIDDLRALALWYQRRGAGVQINNAPWAEPRTDSEGTPQWISLLPATIPLFLTAIWLWQGVARRKALLRRRAPRALPSVQELLAPFVKRGIAGSGTLARGIRSLQAWSSRDGDRLEVGRTIEASLLSGRFTPVYEPLKAQPEYLFLIESCGTGDQETARLRRLVDLLCDRSLSVTIFYFQGEPAWLHPEDQHLKAQAPFAKPALPIANVAARTAHHRLVVVSSGERFLDLRGAPVAGALALTAWPARAMLTPVPVEGWGRRELALTRDLRLPLGRATQDGLVALASLLGLGEKTPLLYSAHGDGGVAALPASLRTQRGFWLLEEPSAEEWVRLKALLTAYLDASAYEWLAACAVYPALHLDIVTYLGLELSGPDGERLYREDRLAALTALPWFRLGYMPVWLRKRLIKGMGDRTIIVREKLAKLVEDAHKVSEPREGIRLRIATGEFGELRQAMKDEVFVEHLARAQTTDLEVNWGTADIQRKKGANALRGYDMASLAVGVAFAALTWLLAPRGGQVGAFDGWHLSYGPILVEAWIPACVSILACVISLSSVDDGPLRFVWTHVGTPFRAFAFALGQSLLGTSALMAAGALSWGGHLLFALLAIASVGILTSRIMLERMGPQGHWNWAFDLVVRSAALAAVLAGLALALVPAALLAFAALSLALGATAARPLANLLMRLRQVRPRKELATA